MGHALPGGRDNEMIEIRQVQEIADFPADVQREVAKVPELLGADKGEMPMRFIAMVKSDERSEAGVMADEKLLSAMGKYNEQLIKAGLMLGGDGLHASAKGARVKVRGKKFSAFDGPFAEAKELVGGYWLLQANSKHDVVDWMKKVPFRDGEIEIRQLYEVDDFPKDPSEQAGNWREQETKAREQSGAPAPATPRKPGTTRWILLLKGDKKSESGELPTESA